MLRSPGIGFAFLGFLMIQGGALSARVPSAGGKADMPPAVAAASSVLRNGDFETSDDNGDWPSGWGSINPGNGKTWESENGGHFMRLVSGRPGELRVLYRSIKLAPGKIRAMNVAIRYRTSGVKAGSQPGEDARALFVFRDSSGKLLDSQTLPIIFSSAAKEWTEVSAQVIVPENASTWILMEGLFRAAAGTVEICEITAQPLDEAATATLLASAPNKPAARDSWVINGGFSKVGPEENWPLDWGTPGPGMSWKTEDGKPFIRVRSQEPGKVFMIHKTIPLKPDVKGIELKIRFRTDGVRYGEHEWFDARTIVHFLGADGKPLANEGGGLDFVFTHKPEPTGWIERVHSYVVPEGAMQMQLMSGLFKASAGTVDLAEIQVTPMGDVCAELLQITDAACRSWKDDEDAAADRKATREIDERLKATGNLVANGGFEIPGKDGGAESWGKGSEDGSLSWQEEKGEYFMRLVSVDPQKIRMLYRMVPLKSGSKALEVKFRYRTAGIVKGCELPGDARAIMHFLNGTRVGHLENGREVEPSPPAIVFSSNANDWTEVSSRFLVPEGATKLQLMPGLWKVKAGTLDLAEICVVPLSGEEADAMLAANAAAQKKKAERESQETGITAPQCPIMQLTVTRSSSPGMSAASISTIIRCNHPTSQFASNPAL